jgi:ribosomal protein S21
MPIEVRRRKNETTNAFIYRFNKRVQQSGILKEVRKRRVSKRAENKTKRRHRALYRIVKQQELAKQRKQGYSAKK